MIILENSMVDNTLKNPAIVEAFPFLRPASESLTKNTTGCKCSRNKIDYNAIKMALAGMPENDRIKLKQLLTTDKIKIIYSINGKVITSEF